MQNLIELTYDGQKFSLLKSEKCQLINASQIAKKYGRKPDNFLRTKSTQLFINELCHFSNMRTDEVLVVKNGGIERGTWMHELLALKFAYWLDPAFELWLTMKLRELLLNGHTQIEKDTASHISDTASHFREATSSHLKKVSSQKREVRKADQRLDELYDLVEEKIEQWEELDKKPKIKRVAFRHHVELQKLLNQFFKKYKSYTKWGDAVHGYQAMQEQLSNFNLMVKPFFGLSDSDMTSEEVNDFIMLMKDLSKLHAKMTTSKNYEQFLSK